MGIRLAIAAAAIVALVGIFTAHNANVRREAVQTERARVSVEAEKKNDKAQAARKRVTADNADDVLAKYYRDKP